MLLLPLGQRRIDDEGTKPLAARSVMKRSKKDSTTDNDEEHDEHDDARERMPEPRMAATVARGNDGLRRTNRLPSKARLKTIMLPTTRNMKTQEAP